MGLINKEWMDEYHEGLVQNLNGKADKSTTLAGYGITDAYTKTQVDAAIDDIDVTEQLADYAKKTEVSTAVSAETTRAQGVEATKANASDVTTALAGKADKTEVTTGLAAKQDTISDLATIRSGAALGATAKQPATTIAGYGITDAYTKQEVNNLVSTPHQQYVTVATKADLDAITTGSADTIYRVSNYDGTQVDATKYAEYAWDGTQFMLLTVKSAVGEVFDVSEYNSGTSYETLAAALAAVPASAKRGGMSIKFIHLTPASYSVVKTEGLTELPTGTELQSASAVVSGTYNAAQLSDFATLPANVGDNVTYYVAVSGDTTTYTTWVITKAASDKSEYVQYRYMSTSTAAANFTNVANWQGVDDEPTPGSKNFVESGGAFDAINRYYKKEETLQLTFNQGKLYNISNGTIVDISGAYAYARFVPSSNLNYIVATGCQTGSNKYALLTFFDSEDNILYSLNQPSTSFNSQKVSIPNNTAYAIINVQGTNYNFIGVDIATLQEKVVEYATPIVNAFKNNFLNDAQPAITWGDSNQVYNVSTGKVVTNIPNGLYGRGEITADTRYISVTGLQFSSNKYAILAIFNSNNEILSSISRPSTNVTNATLEVPAGASYFIVNFNTTVDYSVSSKIDISKEVAKLPSLMDNFNLLDNISTVNGSLKHINGNVVEVTNGAYCVINVAGLSEVYVSGSQHGSTSYPIIAFYDSENTLISYFGQRNTLFIKQFVAVPDNAVTAIMDFLSNFPYGCYIKSINVEPKKNIFYEVGTDEIYVTTKYTNDKDFRIRLRKKTINQYFDFNSFYVILNSEKYPIDVRMLNQTFGTASDFHGPFIVRAVNNIDGDAVDTHHYTGGAHAYNNNYVDGTPTMRCTNLKFYIDDRIVSSAEKGYCSNVRITWTNFVQGYNTKKADGSGREILQENHELIFDGVKWHSYVEIIALEDIVFEKYYGFQYGGMGVYTKVRYADGANKLEYNVADGSYSGDKTCSMIRSYGTEHEIILTLDTLFGLGKREYFEWEGRGALTTTYGKGYLYVICGPDNSYGNCPLNTGEMLVMRGTYQFIPNMIYAQ